MSEKQISKKINDRYGSIINSNPLTVDHNSDVFPFTRAEKIKLDSLYDTKSIVSTIVKEVPTGAVNGLNNTFGLSRVPINVDFLNVFINGIKRNIKLLDYRTFSIEFAPVSGSTIEVNYFTNTTVIDPILSQFNIDKLTNFYNAYMLSTDILTDDAGDVITDYEGKLIMIN